MCSVPRRCIRLTITSAARRRRAPHHTCRLMAGLFVELQRISAQMQAQADPLVSLRASMPDWQSTTMGPAASTPRGPPSAGSSVTDAEPASLPPQSLDCSAAIETACQAAASNMMGVELGKAPSSWVEADQEFCSSAAAQISVATSDAGLSVPLTAQESSSMAPLIKTRAVQNPRKKKRRDRQRDGPTKECAPWIRELGEKWRALSEEERAKQPRWPPVEPPKPAGVCVGPPAIVAGAALGAHVPAVVGAEASSPPPPPPAPLPAAAPLLGLAPCATTTITTTTTAAAAAATTTTTTPWASLPIAFAVPAAPPFLATAPGYPNPLAADQIELANRLAVSRMAEAGPPLAGWPAVTWNNPSQKIDSVVVIQNNVV